jgi:dienelactone hydrolase
MKRFAVALVAGLAWTAVNASAQVQKRDVDIKGPESNNLKGTYLSPGKPGPGLLLLHQCNTVDLDRHLWDSVANDLANAGFHVLTVDFRGYGQSDQKATDAKQAQALRVKWPGDVDAMFNFLLAQPGVDKTRAAAGGAGCGVRQSSNLAARRTEVKALMLLSGGLDKETLDYLTRTPSVALFAATNRDDNFYAKDFTALMGGSTNPRWFLKIYENETGKPLLETGVGSENGIYMFPSHPELQPTIVTWLKAQMMGQGNTN